MDNLKTRQVEGMGCSASSPEAVINNISAMQIQNGTGDTKVDTDPINNNRHPSVNVEAVNEAMEKAEKSSGIGINEEEAGVITDIVELPVVSNEAASQVESQDTIQECSGLGAADGITAKKGYVVFEVNLNGELDTRLDNSKRPLPKRLKVTCYGDDEDNLSYLNIASRTTSRSTEANCRGIE